MLDFVEKKIRKSFGRKIGDIRGGLSELGKRFNLGGSGTGGVLTYPLELRSQVNRPVVCFTAYDNVNSVEEPPTIGQVYFPCPTNISFNDSAEFNNVNIGTLQTGLTEIIEAGKDFVGEAACGINQASAGLDSFLSTVGKTTTGLLKSAALSKFGNFSAAAGVAKREIAAPNAITAFGGNPIRTFTFSFKMIAKSPTEADEIKAIHEFFRKYTYAERGRTAEQTQGNFTLKYPPIWNIDFLDMGFGGDSNKFIPRIFSCYLTGVQSTFNGSANAFHRDGAPLEIDMTVNYTETRELTRDDIVDTLNPFSDKPVGLQPLGTELRDSLDNIDQSLESAFTTPSTSGSEENNA